MKPDGRNILSERGTLTGEGAQMRVRRPDSAWPLQAAARELPVHRPAQVEAETPTYYDLPVVKPPPWKAYIPAYFYVGGVAGAASALSTASWLSRRRDLEALARKSRWIGLIGDAASAALLIADLGRPLRFLNMLRVFRPTSPMNLGTWILTGSGMANGVAAILADSRGAWQRVEQAAGVTAGVLGLPLTTYTAVLLSNTAVPLWARSHRALPILFGASATSSLASVLELVGPSSPGERRVVRTLSSAAKGAELAAMRALERDVGHGRVGRPLRHGSSGTLWKTAKLLGIASLAASLWPGSSRRRGLLAGALGTAGALAMRFAIVEAGKASARDPRATFEPQRRQLEARRGEPMPAALRGQQPDLEPGRAQEARVQ